MFSLVLDCIEYLHKLKDKKRSVCNAVNKKIIENSRVANAIFSL